MSETRVPLDQESIDHEVRNHLDLILPFLERLGAGSSTQVSAGYVEYEHGVDRGDRMTDLGLSLLKQAERVAWDSAGYLWDLTSGSDIKQGVDTKLLDEVQGFLAVVACALKGVDATQAPEGLTAPWVTWHLHRTAEALRRRAEGDEDEEEEVERAEATGEEGVSRSDTSGGRSVASVLRAARGSVQGVVTLSAPFWGHFWGNTDAGVMAVTAHPEGVVTDEGFQLAARVSDAASMALRHLDALHVGAFAGHVDAESAYIGVKSKLELAAFVFASINRGTNGAFPDVMHTLLRDALGDLGGEEVAHAQA